MQMISEYGYRYVSLFRIYCPSKILFEYGKMIIHYEGNNFSFFFSFYLIGSRNNLIETI